VPTIRRELRPGDPEAIVAQHDDVYGREYGLVSEFAAHVERGMQAAVSRGWPAAGEAVWIVELHDRHAGSLGLTDEGDGRGALRWFLLDAELRGQGLGRRLVGELVELAERSGYERVTLETFSELRAAAHLYREAGFEQRASETGPRWGRDQLTYQHYELSFQRRAQSLSSESTGSNERPFSVSA